jgi:hypothetical protein
MFEKSLVVHLPKTFPNILCVQSVHYRVQNSPSLVPVMSHVDAIHPVERLALLASQLHLRRPSGLKPSLCSESATSDCARRNAPIGIRNRISAQICGDIPGYSPRRVSTRNAGPLKRTGLTTPSVRCSATSL